MQILIKNAIFQKLWLSYTFTSVASASLPALISLIVLDLYKDLKLLGIILAFRTVGFIVGAVVSGVVTDRFAHKKVLLASTSLRLLATIGIIFCLYFQWFYPLYGIVSLLGIGEGIFRVAYQAMMADIVDDTDLLSANAVNTLSMRLSLTVVPLLGTMAFVSFGGFISMSMVVLLWIVAWGLLLTLKDSHHEHKSPQVDLGKQSIWQNYREGLLEARRHRWFMAGLAALVVWLSAAYSVQQLLLPLISKETFHDEKIIGIALGAYSVGALLASVVMSKYQPKAYGLWGFIGLSLYGLVPLALMGNNTWWIYAAYFLGGVGVEVFNIPWFTAIQREVPKDKIGRISALDFLVSYGMSPLALAILPFFIQFFGQMSVLLVCGGLTIASALLALLVPGTWYMRDPRRE